MENSISTMGSSIDEILSSGMTLDALLGHRAGSQPGHPAYVWHSFGAEETVATFSYAALDRKAQGIAHIIAKTCAPGSRILLLFPPGLDFVAAFFGCLYAQTIAVPADLPRRRARWNRMESIVRDAAPALLLSTAPAIEMLRNEALPEDLWLTSLPAISIDDIGNERAFDPAPESNPERIAFLQYTSGSTSSPKGVILRHRNVLATMLDMQRGWQHTPESVLVTWLPTFHDMGLIYGALLPIVCGFPCHAMSPASFLQQPARWLQTISRVRGTHSAAANFAYRLCLDKIPADRISGLDLNSWSVAVNGAEPVQPEVLEDFARRFEPCGFRAQAFCPGYGLAESALKVTAIGAHESPRIVSFAESDLRQGRVLRLTEGAPGTRRLVSCGTGEIGGLIRIVDPATLTPCDVTSTGEIWVASDAVAAGYWNRPAETAATFQAALAGEPDRRYLRTGDLGFLYESHLYIAGRIKDLIIVHGLNIYPQDIEATVGACHKQLRGGMGAAFSFNREDADRIVIVHEVSRADMRRIDSEQLTSAIRTAVWDAHELQLDVVVLVRPATIPKTTSGKIQRGECRARFLSGALEELGRWERGTTMEAPLSHFPTSPRSDIEAWSIAWIARQKGIDSSEIHPDIPFADLGISSVEAVAFATAFFEHIGREDSRDTLLWEYPTIRGLSDAFTRPFERSPHAPPEPAINTPDLPLEDLSEDELRRLLFAELQELRANRGQ